jgi:hypothetical protein
VNRRHALLVAGGVGLAAVGVTAIVLATRDDGGRPAAVRTSPSTAPIPAATIRIRTTLADTPTEPVVGDGASFRVTTNRERRCESTPPDWVEYSPYRVEKIDVATDAVVFGTDLPGTCRYGRDNRSALPELVVGSGSAWVRDPATCHLFEIDANTGALVRTSEVVGGLVAADDGGPWVATGPGPGGSSPSCAPGATGIELARLDRAGTVSGTFRLPGSRGIVDAAVADGVAWVSFVAGARTTPTLARVDADTGAVQTTPISPGDVAAGSGQVWFLGTFPEAEGANPGLLGELDPRTGTVRRTLQLDLGSGTSPVATIAAVTDDAVWIVTRGSPRELIQVAT